MAALVRRRPLLFLSAILLLGLGLRLWGIAWGLHDANVSRRPHPDEWVVYWVFRWFDAHQDLNPCPGPNGSPHQQCFYDWGGLYLYLTYAVKAVGAPILALFPHSAFGSHADPVFIRAALSGRITSVLTSTITIAVVYRLGVVVRSIPVGLVAALVVALSGLLVQLAHFATPDSTTILFMSLTLLATASCLQVPTLGRFAVAGAATGLSAGSEYHMAVLALPIAGAWLMAERRDWRFLVIAAACAVLAWILVNPYAVLQPGAFLDSGLHSVRLRTVDNGTTYPDRWAPYGPAILYVVRYALGYGVGFALTLWLVAGVVWTVARRDRVSLLLLLFVVPYFLIVTVSPAKYMRYSAPLIPPLAVLAAIFLIDVLGAVRRPMRPILVAVALVSVLYTFAYDGAYARLFSSPDARQIATVWLVRHAPRHADVGFEQIPDGVTNLPFYVTAAGFHPCFSTFRLANLSGRESYFVADSYAREEHPNVATSRVRRFISGLEADRQYRAVFRARKQPTWLGLSFPIDGSPHDWRYPARSITVYRHLTHGERSVGQCYATLGAAQQALYVPPADPSG